MPWYVKNNYARRLLWDYRLPTIMNVIFTGDDPFATQ